MENFVSCSAILAAKFCFVSDQCMLRAQSAGVSPELTSKKRVIDPVLEA